MDAKSFPSELKPTKERVADWVEFRALQQVDAFKRADLRSAIGIEDVDDPELLEENVWGVLKLRQDLFQRDWPLILNGSRLSRRRPCPVSLPLYRYLLLLGMGEIEDVDRQLFEFLTAEAVSVLTQHQSLRLGAPAAAGADPSFRKRIEDYVKRSQLVVGREFVSLPLPNDQDFGLDVASWFPFRDGRSGYMHVIAQCATGDDWSKKLKDLDVAAWSDHINWSVPPMRVLAVPLALTLIPNRWIRTTRFAGLILDRARFLELERRNPLDAALATTVRGRVAALAT